MLSVVVSSYHEGPAFYNGYDCTGAETGTPTATFRGCGNGSTACHGSSATATLPVTLEIDSTATGTPVTSYVPGRTYYVKISGTNNTALTLPKYGFQVTAIKGTTASASPVNAGTFQSTGLPANVQYTPHASPDSCNIVEHSNSLSPASGSGAAGTTYVTTFTWTAPASGTGTVSFWGALNAVSGTYTHEGSTANPDSTWNVAMVSLTENTHVGVAEVNNEIALNVYPNPVVNNLNIQVTSANQEGYTYQVYDMTGRVVVAEQPLKTSTVVAAGNWRNGIYLLKVTGNGTSKTTTIVKQ